MISLVERGLRRAFVKRAQSARPWRLDIVAPAGAADGSLGQSEGRRSRATPQVGVPEINLRPGAPAGAPMILPGSGSWGVAPLIGVNLSY